MDIKETKCEFEKDDEILETPSEQEKKIAHHYSPHLFENDLNEYELALQLISNFAENNNEIKGKMKDYLREQYNNSKNHNFIVILSGIVESFISNTRHTVGNRNGGQAFTTIESIVPYARHNIANRYGGQTAAICKSNIPNGSNAIVDSYGGQATTIKSTIIYGRHAIGDNQILYFYSV